MYEVYGEQHFLDVARRAYEYVARHFCDAEHDGVFWMVDHKGAPIETKKRIYGQAFALYSLAEYYRATRDNRAGACNRPVEFMERYEHASHDPRNSGYFETFERDWTIARDQRLSDVDMDEKKSMNTHLHVMEGYATLLQAWEMARSAIGSRVDRSFSQHDIEPARLTISACFSTREWQLRNRIHVSMVTILKLAGCCARRRRI